MNLKRISLISIIAAVFLYFVAFAPFGKMKGKGLETETAAVKTPVSVGLNIGNKAPEIQFAAPDHPRKMLEGEKGVPGRGRADVEGLPGQ